MQNVIVTNHKSFPSAKVLTSITGLHLKYPWEVTMNEDAIHWGCDVGTHAAVAYNRPERIRRASNKLACSHFLNRGDIRTLPFTARREAAKVWWDAGRTVYARTLMSSCEGKGIVLANKAKGVPIPPAPMYTLYCRPTFEVRVFSGLGVCSLVYIKKRMGPEKLASLGLWQPNFWIRSYQHGWVYTALEEGYCRPWYTRAVEEAKKARVCLGLDFCAVDMNVVLSDGAVKTRVIEVNTAPGIENTRTKEWFAECVDYIIHTN